MRILLFAFAAHAVACAADAPPAQEPTALPMAPPIARGDVEPNVRATRSPTPALTWTLRHVASATGKAYVFELDARQFPARALDPVLEIDGRRVTSYEYVSPTVLRFVVPGAIPVQAGAHVMVQYGDDAGTRRVLTTALDLGMVR